LNCLPPGEWYVRQPPIWKFDLQDVRAPFERYSRKVHPAIFPRVLARQLIETYSHEGETVMDIFSGVGTTLVSALELGRNALGLELNRRYIDIARRRITYARDMRKKHRLKCSVLQADARNLMDIIPENSIDLVVTSPPYWDMLKQRPSARNRKTGKYLKKNYSKSSSDLSNLSSLESFHGEMNKIFLQVKHILKPGGRFVLVTGDYRRQGTFIPLHSHYIDSLKGVGFELNNIIFWDRTNEYDVGLFGYPHYFLAINGMVEYILEFMKA
jgi:DNA modification methylase